MPHTVRAMTTADLTAVAKIIDATDLFPSEMLSDMTADYLSGDAPDMWWIAVTNDGPIGVAFCQPERMTDGTWNLLALAVHPDQQGTGVGYALIDHTRTVLRKANARLLLIETADIPEFADQRAFYERAGLTQAAHIPDYYEAGVGKVTFTQSF